MDRFFFFKALPKSSPPISTSEPFLSLQLPKQANTHTHKQNRMPGENIYLKHVHILENAVNICIINDLSYPPANNHILNNNFIFCLYC